jgi:hypothetical protein
MPIGHMDDNPGAGIAIGKGIMVVKLLMTYGISHLI